MNIDSNSNNSKKSLYILLFNIFLQTLVFLFIVYFVYSFSFEHVIMHDDTSFVYNNETPFQKYFLYVYKAKYIGSFLTSFVGFYFPKLLNIHPNVWIKTGGAIIKGITMSLLVFSISKSLFITKKINFLYPLCAFTLYMFIQTSLIGKYQGVLYASFYCFTFMIIFYSLFWQKFIKEYLLDNNTKYNLIILGILAFLLGTSSELTSISSFISLLIFISISIIKYKKITKVSIYSIIGLIAGMIVFYANPIFLENARGKQTLDGNTINNAIAMFDEFVQGYKSTFNDSFLILTLIILVLLVIIQFCTCISKKDNIIYLISSLTIGGFAFLDYCYLQVEALEISAMLSILI